MAAEDDTQDGGESSFRAGLDDLSIKPKLSNVTKNAEDEKDPYSSDVQRELDALWSSFCLPVPIPEAIQLNGDKARFFIDKQPIISPDDEWLVKAIDLENLLHTMNEQYTENTRDGNRARGARIMNSQMALAYSQLANLVKTFPSVTPSPQQVQEYPEILNHAQLFYKSADRLLNELRTHAEETCSKFTRWLESRNRRSSLIQMEGDDEDLIYDIFLAPPTPKELNWSERTSVTVDEIEDWGLEELEEEEEDNNKQAGVNQTSSSVQQPTHIPQPPQQQQQPASSSTAIDPVEFQKQQQELLEQELASMATRLKQSTLAMNQTLKTQTADLDDFEELAQKNLDQVTDTTKKVQDRLQKKKGWKKRIATWSLIGTVLGMWVICFMVMRTVPKRHIKEIHVLSKISKGTQTVFNVIGDGAGAIGDTWRAFVIWHDKYFDKYDEEEEERRKFNELVDRKQAAWREARQREREEEERQRREREEQQECEVLADGTQICYERGSTVEETKARAIAAERKQRRIEENMAKAQRVDAVDHSWSSDDDEDSEDDSDDSEDEEEDSDDQEGDGSDPMGCIPPTEEILKAQGAIDSISKGLAGIADALNRLPEDSTQGLQMASQMEKLQSELKKHKTTFAQEQNKARSAHWADREVRLKARQHKRALGSIPFCDGEEETVVDSSNLYEEMEARYEEAKRYDEQRRAAKERREEEFDRRRKEEEIARAEEEAARKAEEEATRKAELQRLEQERILAERRREEEAEAQRLEDERLAKEAAERERERVNDERERWRLRRQRLEKAKLASEKWVNDMEGAKKAERDQIEAEKRLELERQAFMEEKRLEYERIQQRKQAAEEAKRAQLERIEQAKLERERTLADAKTGAMGILKDAEASSDDDLEDFTPADVRLAAGRSKNDMLARYITASPDMLDASDRGGWRPIHEAVRAGNIVGIEMLVYSGCDLNARTGRTGNGGTALWWAVHRFGQDHPAVEMLRSHGALEAGPHEA